jgi:hypothetical protein
MVRDSEFDRRRRQRKAIINARENETRLPKIMKDKTMKDKTILDKTTLDKTRQDKTMKDNERQDNTRQENQRQVRPMTGETRITRKETLTH